MVYYEVDEVWIECRTSKNVSFHCPQKHNNTAYCCGEVRCCLGIGPYGALTFPVILLFVMTGIILVFLILLIGILLVKCFGTKKVSVQVELEGEKRDSSSIEHDITVCFIEQDIGTGKNPTMVVQDITQDVEKEISAMVRSEEKSLKGDEKINDKLNEDKKKEDGLKEDNKKEASLKKDQKKEDGLKNALQDGKKNADNLEKDKKTETLTGAKKTTDHMEKTKEEADGKKINMDDPWQETGELSNTTDSNL